MARFVMLDDFGRERNQHACVVADVVGPGAKRPGRAVTQEAGPGPATPEGQRTSGPDAGLVTYAITDRRIQEAIADAWRPSFPRSDLVSAAAGLLPSLPAWRGEEGPRFRIVVSPGALAVESRDLAKAERSYERQAERDARRADMHGAWLAEDDDLPDAPVRGDITEWSRKSRNRMTRCLCELDYEPLLALGRLLAVVTLTYPGDWLPVAPDGAAVKRHMKIFRKRWLRAWDEDLAGPWKLEFQRRGAPHIHMLTAPPSGLARDGRPFKVWLSQTWAQIVAHPDPEQYRRHVAAGTGVDYAEGLRARDPKRIAVYFTKHGTFGAKEYQNEVPLEWREAGKGPGRFWGIWVLKRCTVAVEVTPDVAAAAARTMRRWARAEGTTHEVRAPRARGGAVQTDKPVVGLAGAMLVADHRVRKRKVRRRVRRLKYGRGWISLNDAPAFTSQLARYLA